MSENMANERC